MASSSRPPTSNGSWLSLKSQFAVPRVAITAAKPAGAENFQFSFSAPAAIANSPATTASSAAPPWRPLTFIEAPARIKIAVAAKKAIRTAKAARSDPIWLKSRNLVPELIPSAALLNSVTPPSDGFRAAPHRRPPRAEGPRAGPEGLRARRHGTPWPAPAVRRGLCEPPARGGGDPRGPAARRPDFGRRALARHRGGHRPHRRRGRDRVRGGGGPPGRGRHQAGPDLDPHRPAAAGGEHPQDDGGDGRGPSGGPHQARRPPPQHAHARSSTRGEAPQDLARDAGHLRPAGAPARDRPDQVGARGPRLPQPGTRGLRRRRQADRPQAQRPRNAGFRPARDTRARARQRGHRGRDHRPAEAHLLGVAEDDPREEGLLGDLRP